MNEITYILSILIVAGLSFLASTYFLRHTAIQVFGQAFVVFGAITALMALLLLKLGALHLVWVLPVWVLAGVAAIRMVWDRVQVPMDQLTTVWEGLSNGELSFETDNIWYAGSGRFSELKKATAIHVDRLKEIVRCTNEIGDGNLHFDLTLTSDKDELGASLKKMQTNLKETILGVQQVLDQASIKGNMNERIDQSGREGVWLELSQLVNALLDSFARPLKNLNEIVNALADGDLTLRYTDQETGDVKLMANNLNKALDNIDGLLSKVSENVNLIDESTQEMKASSSEMNTNTNEIATSITEMSHGTHNQMMKIDEASGLIEKIRKSSREMGDQAESIHKAANKGLDVSQQGIELMSNLVRDIEHISDFTQQVQGSIDVLGDRSNEISKVLNLISEIAAQTNLLALNATIEAAQAGEAGRGFAVVAEEIRKLADGSRKSAEDIEQLVYSIQQDTTKADKVMASMVSSVSQGQQTCKATSQAFRQVLDTSQETLSVSELILEASKEQVMQISSMVNITQSIVVIAEESAAGAEQVASSASELSSGMTLYAQKSQHLAEIADAFKDGVSMLKLSAGAKDNQVIFAMKEAFEKEKALLDALLNNLPDLIYFKDQNSKFIRNSQSHAVECGVATPQLLLGKSDFDFYGEHARKSYEDEQNIIRTGKPLINLIEKVDSKKMKDIRYMSTTKMPLRNNAGDIVGTFGVTRDVTELKGYEIQLKDKVRQLEDCMRENAKLKQSNR